MAMRVIGPVPHSNRDFRDSLSVGATAPGDGGLSSFATVFDVLWVVDVCGMRATSTDVCGVSSVEFRMGGLDSDGSDMRRTTGRRGAERGVRLCAEGLEEARKLGCLRDSFFCRLDPLGVLFVVVRLIARTLAEDRLDGEVFDRLGMSDISTSDDCSVNDRERRRRRRWMSRRERSVL
jgi:hypothetical protein